MLLLPVSFLRGPQALSYLKNRPKPGNNGRQQAGTFVNENRQELRLRVEETRTRDVIPRVFESYAYVKSSRRVAFKTHVGVVFNNTCFRLKVSKLHVAFHKQSCLRLCKLTRLKNSVFRC